MKTLIVILILAAFLQTTILPIDLILLILVCRAYIKPQDVSNFYLAFGFGLLTSYLNLTTLGFDSIIYLIITAATGILSKSRLSGNPLLLVPISLMFLSLNQLINSYFNNGQTFNFSKIILISFLSLPIFYLLRLWEERFIIHKEIKLKI